MDIEQRNQYIIQLYQSGKNTVSIAKELGISSSTVQRYLKKQGYSLKRRTIELSPTEWEDIILRFKAGERLKSIYESHSNKFGCAETLARMLEREGVKTEKLIGGFDRLNVDDNYFDKINTEEKAYFLGLLITDGFITESKNTVGIELDSKDLYIIEAFKKALQSEHKIVTSRNCYRFTFVSKKMIQDLSKYGVIANKTTTTYLPQLERHLMPHLIRGILDGDGTVYRRKDGDGKRRCSFGFYGTPSLLEGIRNIMHKEIGTSQSKIHKKNGCSMMYFGKQKDIIAFYNWVYKDASIYMTRKREKFDSYLQEYVNTERACITSLCNA